MVNSYPAHIILDNSALFISRTSCYYTVRWTVPTFLLTYLMLQSPCPHHTADRTMRHCINLSEQLTYKTQIIQVVLFKSVYLLLLW